MELFKYVGFGLHKANTLPLVKVYLNLFKWKSLSAPGRSNIFSVYNYHTGGLKVMKNVVGARIVFSSSK